VVIAVTDPHRTTSGCFSSVVQPDGRRRGRRIGAANNEGGGGGFGRVGGWLGGGERVEAFEGRFEVQVRGFEGQVFSIEL